jgi:hypothetical protein
MLGTNNTKRYTGGDSSELVSSIVLPVVVFFTLMVVDYLYRASTDKSLRFITVLDYTASSSDGIVIISQDPNKLNSAQLGVSVNERTGVEFAYSFFLNVHPSNFTGNEELRHVFHKGYRVPWPLLGPGVFISGLTNTMRVVMNMNTNIFYYADVTNIPVGKWFHVVLNCYKSGLDIYVNGRLAHRIPFAGGVIYQNFQDLILFAPNTMAINPTNTPAIGTDNTVNFAGSFNGQLSSIKYARYALSVNEIQNLMTSGPSMQIKKKEQDKPPYFAADWWPYTSS